MPQLKVTVLVELDGEPIAPFPYVRRLTVTEAQAFEFSKATGGGYTALPTEQIASLKALAVRATDQTVTVRLDAQSDAGILLSAGGLVLIVDATIDAGASTNATVDNSSGSATILRGLGAG